MVIASGRGTERLDHSSIVSLFPSSAHPIGSATAHFPSLIISSSHLIDGEKEPPFPFRPTPSRLLFSACLLGFVPPSPAGGCDGCGMACGGGRATCLLAFSCPVPLSRCRSFAVAIRSVSIVPSVPAWGVVGSFMGFSDRYLVGVGVSQNMPLNRILWLLVGIFGDVVRCHFSALPVASFSLVCPALRPLSAAASWCRGGHVCAVSWRKRRGVPFRDRGRSPLPASWDGRCRVCGLPCRADGVGGSSCLPLSVRSSPCPLGRGIM